MGRGTRARIGALCDRSRPRSRPNEAVDDELMIEGGAVGLELGRAVMVVLRVCLVCGFAGLLGLWVCWFAVDYRWIAVVGLHFAMGF
ncbi:hypothetical protein FCV25MIE_24796 [Fagus crenata]